MQTETGVEAQIREALARFNDLVSTKDLRVLDEFVADDVVILVGSEDGEVAAGGQELQVFFARIFARDAAFSWEWDRVEIFHQGSIAWFFADGQVVLTTSEGQQRMPYRTSGVLEHQDGRWLWRQYHGAEPAGRAGKNSV